ncbi:class F sortase [Micromonospora echinofusca]|uniref:Class F sortase n=1 Tax=Micromonospora echinofusca TaxID=47858 RepID=A0ABS3VWD7_MICEH|nr:class F sortase [Micromonospora echinofusca]MBO4208847.1 class F sortase [Micromonospora echinofusca]
MTRGAGGRPGAPWRVAGPLLVVLVALAGVGLIGLAVTAPDPVTPPQPAAGADLNAPLPAPPTAAVDPDLAGGNGPSADPGLPHSAPVQVTIERIKVRADVLTLGTRSDGSVEVPPLSRAHLAGWYGQGPSPGETGNAVLMGHVDSAALGPAVFFRLGELAAGDRIRITRQDRSVVQFRVDEVRSYPKKSFPSALVYGPSDRAGLRLVTCGGTFDRQRSTYLNNIIVFATRV